MKDISGGDQTPPEPAVRADHRAPGKVTATRALGAPVQRSAAPNAGAMAGSPPRSMSECVPISSDGSFLDSIIGPQVAPASSPGGALVQRKDSGGVAEPDVHALADHGTSGATGQLPFMDQIQASFGAHDVSGIHSHNDGNAADAARTMGATAFATGDHVAFGGAPDLHTAAHEAAHVVQQRGGGVQLKGGVGQVGDAYEQHADAVADAVVRGESAEGLLDDSGPSSAAIAPVQRRAVQLFGAKEHKDSGDLGSGGQVYERGGLELTHGDLVMLRGDHFKEDEIRKLWARRSILPGQRPGTQDEIIYGIHLATGGSDPRFQEDGPWHGLKFSDAVKKVVDDKYLAFASKNDDHFVNPTGAAVPEGGVAPGGATATYRDAHERAIAAAYRAGTRGASIDDAMITEAMGEHFLTDAFAAGHIATPRTQIRDHWNALYPHFGLQFKAKVTKDMAAHLKATAHAGTMAIPEGTYRSIVGDQIEAQLAGKPDISLGDMVGLVAHDYDNDHGLWVVNDVGYRWLAKGDGKLREVSSGGPQSERSHLSVVLEAVHAGVEDIRTAFALGVQQKGTPLSSDQVLDQIRQRAGAPAKPGARYAPEQFMPRPDPDSGQGKQYWRSESIEGLWHMHVRDGSRTYGELILDGFANGLPGKTLDDLAMNIPAKQVPIPLLGATLVNHVAGPRAHFYMGWVYPRLAFQRAVINRLKTEEGCYPFIIELVNNE